MIRDTRSTTQILFILVSTPVRELSVSDVFFFGDWPSLDGEPNEPEAFQQLAAFEVIGDDLAKPWAQSLDQKRLPPPDDVRTRVFRVDGGKPAYEAGRDRQEAG